MPTTHGSAELYTLFCPHCGHGDVAGCDTVPAFAGIEGWRDDPVTGAPVPEWDGSTEVVWSGQRPSVPEAPYRCRNCGAHLAATDLHRTSDLPRTPKAAPAQPVARVVIIMRDGVPHVVVADANVSAVIVDAASVITGASPRPISVTVQPEYTVMVFAGQG